MIIGDVVYKLYKFIYEISYGVQMLWGRHFPETRVVRIDHGCMKRAREQELTYLCNRGYIAEHAISIICKQRPQYLYSKKTVSQLCETVRKKSSLVPKAGLEPARVSPPPPQDGVSTRFHHFGTVSPDVS